MSKIWAKVWGSAPSNSGTLWVKQRRGPKEHSKLSSNTLKLPEIEKSIYIYCSVLGVKQKRWSLFLIRSLFLHRNLPVSMQQVNHKKWSSPISYPWSCLTSFNLQPLINFSKFSYLKLSSISSWRSISFFQINTW